MERLRCRFVDEYGKPKHSRNDVTLLFSTVPQVDDYIQFKNRSYLVMRRAFHFRKNTKDYSPTLDLYLDGDKND